MYSSRTRSLILVIEELLRSRAADGMLDLDELDEALEDNTLDQFLPITAVRLFPHLFTRWAMI